MKVNPKTKELSFCFNMKAEQKEKDMILKEFWLLLEGGTYDLCYGSREELWKIEHDFFIQTRCITHLFEKCFQPIKTEECWRVIVICSKNAVTEKILTGDVCEVNVQFDYEQFQQATDLDKRKIMLQTLMKGLRQVVPFYGWPMESFKQAEKEVMEKEYVHEWYWKKNVRRQDGKYKVSLYCCHNINDVTMYMILNKKNGQELARKEIISEEADDSSYIRFFGKIIWKTETEVWLMHKGGPNAVWARKVDFSKEIQIAEGEKA